MARTTRRTILTLTALLVTPLTVSDDTIRLQVWAEVSNVQEYRVTGEGVRPGEIADHILRFIAVHPLVIDRETILPVHRRQEIR